MNELLKYPRDEDNNHECCRELAYVVLGQFFARNPQDCSNRGKQQRNPQDCSNRRKQQRDPHTSQS